jgi:CHAT domain-containing protein
VLIGHQATFSAIKQTLPTVDLFHFAGHSAVEAGSVRLLLAGEELEGDRRLPSALDPTILPKGLFRRCSLAVLAACSTERSRTGWLNVDGLVFALLNSGVPDVIATRWNIDSQASSTFMDSFYASLRLGSTPSRALQTGAAKLREDPRTRHPFYWAAFVDFSRY